MDTCKSMRVYTRFSLSFIVLTLFVQLIVTALDLQNCPYGSPPQLTNFSYAKHTCTWWTPHNTIHHYGTSTLNRSLIRNSGVEVCHPQCIVFIVQLLSQASMTPILSTVYSKPIFASTRLRKVRRQLHKRWPRSLHFFTDQLNMDVHVL